MFERLATGAIPYAHDDPGVATVNVGPESAATVMRTAARAPPHIGVRAGIGGILALGRWQRVFLVDFDGGQRRQVSVTLIGETRTAGPEYLRNR